MNQTLINFVIDVLDDEDGICCDGFVALQDMVAESQGGIGLDPTGQALVNILEAVEAQGSRYYLPVNHPVIEQYRRA